ncbi:serine/threonine-protein kinase RIO3-like isoform X2 [Artemia franciscana]|uniref:Serine/threonine-protein kinase RIO3 n=2 Tax=Artemia franciscana TaxID=6661 RepID=A0AA88I899_ARTSF|nr:hypothetical protein QYM36_000484 [Artemia franciscana]
MSPWGKPPPQTSLNLEEVMSEQLASHLQESEEKALFDEGDTPFDEVSDDHLAEFLDTSSDEMLAKMLQIQLDVEYDKELELQQLKKNGNSKVSVSYEKYKMSPGWLSYSSSDEEPSIDEKKRDWDTFETEKKQNQQLPRCGYAKKGEAVVTKHDSAISARKNVCKMMEFPPGIETGDAGDGYDVKLSNKVYNKLKTFSVNESKRLNRVTDKTDKSTAEMALDATTRRLLFKMIENNILDRVDGIISTGKEAVVLHAAGGQSDVLEVPRSCVAKVFKTTLNEFKKRADYIREDYRFKDRFSKQNPRKFIHMWAEKEMHNLTRMKEFGIACPDVVYLKKHILVMSLIGEDEKPAKKIKESILREEESLLAYKQTSEMMARLYKEARLVHGDLSEYNILWHQNQCYFIDVSQSVDLTHPHALEFLYRDCLNITNFFNRLGVPGVLLPEDLFRSISDLDVHGSQAEILSKIQDYERNEELLTHSASTKTYPFDYCWDKLQSESGSQ